MSAAIRLSIEKITVDREIQSRVALDEATINEYADAYRAGEALPAVKVFFDGIEHWLVDGFHRVAAAKLAGLTEIDVDKQLGARRQAVLHSVAANAKHGLRRTADDKRKAVEMVLADEYWSDWSGREVARACCVSPPFVEKVRSSLQTFAVTAPAGRTYTTKHGTVATMQTAAIGKSPAAPAAPTVVVAATRPEVAVTDHKPERASKPITVTCERIDDQGEILELRDRLDEMARNLKETMAEVETLTSVVEADDQVTAALAEAKKAAEMNRVLQSRVTGLMNENAASIRLVKSWQRRAERAEAALAKLSAGKEGER